jgi:hypothetical protein
MRHERELVRASQVLLLRTTVVGRAKELRGLLQVSFENADVFGSSFWVKKPVRF